MSIAEQVQTINRGLFTEGEHQPHTMRQILDNGTQQVVNWRRLRPAVVAIREMRWHRLDPQWDYFLDEDRYPVGRPMDLRPDEVNTFNNLVSVLIDQTREPMRILTSVHPAISLNDVSVSIEATDLEILEKAIAHVQRTAHLAAVDDAVAISSIQPGSIEIFLTAAGVTKTAIRLAIVLAKTLKDPKAQESVRHLTRLARRKDIALTDEEAIETVLEDTQDDFWETASEPLQTALNGTKIEFPEARHKINQAAKEIYANADDVSADWKLPPAVITGLPNNLTVSLYQNPEALAQTIKALAAPSESNQENAE